MGEHREPAPGAGAEAARWRWQAAMLARAGRLLAAPGDVEPALARLARHLVPSLADWCVIDVAPGPPTTLAAAHIAPAREGELRACWETLRSQGLGADGYAALLRGRRSLALADVPAPGVAAGPRAAYFAALRDLHALASLTVGLQANGRVLGALTVAQVRPGRAFDPHDLSLAQRLAHQCALAVENARLHRAAWAELAERRQVEAALRESEERLRFLIESTSDVIAVVDPAGALRYVSPAVERLLGYRPAEALGRCARDFVHPDDLPEAEATLLAGRPERAVAVVVVRVRHRDGTWRRLEVALVGRQGPPLEGAILSCRDITERERAAAELAEARRRLAVAREEERLRLARELHDGPVQQLLGIAYHLGVRELVAPWAAGEGPAALSSGDLRREVLDVATRLRSLVGELRPAGLEEFGLPAALAAFVDDLGRERAGVLPAIELDLAEAEGLPPALARTLFAAAQEALLNALRHARAHRIVVAARRRPGSVTLTVRDDGRGFRPPAHLGEFARADHFGLLGLAERVELAGGRVRVESAPGAGTAMVARLPLPTTGGEDGRVDPGAAGR